MGSLEETVSFIFPTREGEGQRLRFMTGINILLPLWFGFVGLSLKESQRGGKWWTLYLQLNTQLSHCAAVSWIGSWWRQLSHYWFKCQWWLEGVAEKIHSMDLYCWTGSNHRTPLPSKHVWLTLTVSGLTPIPWDVSLLTAFFICRE